MNRATLVPYYAFLFSLFSLGTALQLAAQNMQVTKANTAPFTPNNLITNIFLGDGVEVLNVSFSGQPTALGYFTDGTQAVGLQRGIVMSSGLTETANPLLGQYGCTENGNVFANNNLLGYLPGFDADLSPLATDELYDITSYVITFIPSSDTLRFRYCFASEEYPEFACSEYNDIFGFFIQGPNYPSPTNIALIPGTNLPVSINNIHPDNSTPNIPCPPKNALYYINNTSSNKQPTYDGLTRVFTAEAIVVPCQTYTMKLIIADVGDPNYDSGVFLEAKSFGTGAVRAELITPSLDGTITEGCGAGSLSFKLSAPAEKDFPLDYQLLGTAINGLDYQTIPAGLFIPAGQQEITIPIIAFEDGLPEPGEFLAIDIRRNPCRRDTIQVFIRENAIAPPDQLQDTSVCLGSSAVALNGTLPVPLPAPPSFTNSLSFSIAPVNTSITSTINVFGVLPTTLKPGMIKSVCLNATHGWADDLDVYLVSPGGQFMELMTDCGANGKNFTSTCFTPDASKPIGQATALDAPFTGNWQPEGFWSDLWSGAFPVNGNWKLQVKDDQNGFAGTLIDWTITFEPLYEINYLWSPIAGLSCPDCPITDALPDVSTTYHLEAVDSYGCTMQDSVLVEVFEPLEAPLIICSAFTDSTLTFSWMAVPGASGYLVNVNGGGWISPSGSLEHQVTGLVPSTLVNIEVQALSNSFSPCPPTVATASCSNCTQPVVVLNATHESCNGFSDGTATLIPDGANPPYNFDLGGQTNSSGNFNNLPAGNYTATITDNVGCQTLLPVNIQPATELLVNIVPSHISCFGGDNGALTATGTGGAPPISYQWNDPANQSLATASNLLIGSYTVTATDAQGCTSTGSATLNQPPDLTLFVTAGLVKCFGDSSGLATVTSSGGIGPYQYAWSTGQTGPVATGLKAGNYQVTVTDAAGCAKTSFALIGAPSPITATIGSTDVPCFNQASGTASVMAQGGTGTLGYLWNDNNVQTTALATGLTAGVYTVTISDQNGCTSTQSATVNAPPAIVLSSSSKPLDCYGNHSGSATAFPAGGTGNFSFMWSDPLSQMSPTAVNLPVGIYTVTATDLSGCTATSTVSITQPDSLQLLLLPQDISCFGQANGAISSMATGGNIPFSYLWSSGETSSNISNKISGNYTLTLTDAKGCSAIATSTIGDATPWNILPQANPVSCFGGSNGGIELTVSGGASPYAAGWTGPNAFSGSGLLLNGLAAGTYTATITDATGCSQNFTTEITQPAEALALGLPITGDTICFGASNGIASTNASGGIKPYSFKWTVAGQTSPSLSGLSAGSYTVTLTDANNCTISGSIFIPQKEQLVVWTEADAVECFGSPNGAARVTKVAYGATAADLNAFSYSWSSSPLQTGIQANGLYAGQTYTVTVTDNRGCSATQTATIGGALQVIANIISSANPTCFGGADGRLIAGGQNGTAPYAYTWSPTVTSFVDSLAQQLSAGTYRVTVTDSKGCTGSTSATLGQPEPLKVNFQTTAVLCFGENTGAAKALPSGGTPGYQFLWSIGATTAEINKLAAGPYELTLTDQNGCTFSKTVDIDQPATPLGGNTVAKDAACFGSRSGEIKIAGTGGTPPYRYALDNAAWNGSSIQFGLPAGTYSPRIQDKNGCTVTLPTVDIQQLPALSLELGPDITITYGESAQLMATVSNAAGTVSYFWTPADSLWLSCLDCPAPFVDELEFGRWFELLVLDSLGCSAVDRVQVVVKKERKVFVPTGFSPNGDGSNDRLLVHGQAETKALSFQVFDRWGELLFEGGDFFLNAPDAGWDGTFRGSPVNPGVYVWVLEVEYADGVREVYRGGCSLIR